ncbi:MAG: dTMP kinase [Planctomycetaceae bacterium]|jgi:dTMP kinase|nr:dTMP kinase [Planctomycetaceae bacterium]
MFITLDGGDGCGKSTQVKHLTDYLQSLNRQTVVCCDPGSTPLGDAVRNILLHRRELTVADLTEMFLFMAARAQLVSEVIRPALAAGKDVVSDRFLLSTYVYQGYAGGVPAESLEAAAHIAVGNTVPDLGIVLDIPYEVAVERLDQRSEPDRMERKGEEYHRRVREGFLKCAAAEPNRYVVINAAIPADDIAVTIQHIVQKQIDQKK